MKKLFFASVLMFVSLCLQAQIKVYPLDEASSKNAKGNSIAYSLPTSTLKITVTEIKVTEVKGYFSDYAESLLGLTNVIQNNKTYYKIANINIESIATPDYSNTYIICGKDFSSLTDLFFSNDKKCSKSKSYSSHKSEMPEFFKNYADISYVQQSEAFVDTKIIDGVVTQVPANHTKMVSKSYEQKAKQAADAIIKSRNDQYSLASGEQETPYSADAIKTMLDELKTWENNYMSLFTGVYLYDTNTYVIYTTPAERQTNVELFTFSSEKGMAEYSNKSSNEVYSLELTPNSIPGNISNSINDIKSLNDKTTEFRYKNPLSVGCVLLKNNNKIFDLGNIKMYQFSDIQIISTSNGSIAPKKIGFVL